ncbi:hypothetical protein ACUIJN_17020 [Metabacillus halosaccharovorans]|uniref:hypothetical protein n=1 Tax=Metabacillus halosaccharovorans TaxID=930124 RepID=UPI00403E06BE
MLSQQNRLLIESYYRHIRELFIQLDIAQLHSSNEQAKNEALEELKTLHNKLSITHLMGDRSLLAVTGLQGTGKSTIIRRLYDIPYGLLPENSGRGERLPVFITESKVDKITTFVYRLKKDNAGKLQVTPESVPYETFTNISLNPVANRDLWLECVVPERYLKDESKSIVLLPGFEQDNKDISQLLLEHVLYLSNSSVMALDKDTYARESTQNMINRVKEIYQHVKPVVAITFGDVHINENESFKQEVMKEFEIPSHEQNRVVITGLEPKFQEDWKTNLMDSINNYGFSNHTEELLTNELILSLVKKADVLITKVNKLVDKELKQRQLKQAEFDDRRTVLTNFETEYGKVLKDLEEQIEATLKQRIEPAKEELRDYLKHSVTWPKELKTKFFGQKPEELYQLEKKLQEIWDKPYGEVTVLEKSEVIDQKGKTNLPANLAILQVVTNYLTNYGKEIIESIEDKGKLSTFQPDEVATSKEDEDMDDFFGAISTKSDEKNELKPIERIDAYFATKDQVPIKLERNDYKTMTVIGTMLIHETYKPEAGLKNGTELPTDLLEQAAPLNVDFVDKVKDLSIAAPNILKSIPIILGVDGVIDGELDLLTNASAALASIGINLSAVQIAGIVGAGFVTAYAAKAIQESIRKANERQLQLAQAGKRVFDELPAIQAKAFTNSLKRVYERMADQLLDKHLELTGQYDAYGEMEQIGYTTRKISKLCQEIKRQQYERSLLI